MPNYVKKEVLFVRQVEKTFSYTDKGGFNSDPPIIFLAFSKGDQIFLKGVKPPQTPANRPLHTFLITQ